MRKKLLALIVAGSMLGGFTAATMPVQDVGLRAVPGESCWCSDVGAGSKQCNLDHDACVAGSETCVVCCGEPEFCGKDDL